MLRRLCASSCRRSAADLRRILTSRFRRRAASLFLAEMSKAFCEEGNIKERIEGVIFGEELDEKIKPLLKSSKKPESN
ncbi:MAG: hypothetical protein LH614_08080 [Pyrinomonadaceae bacterium]|nr:hypothetical protein [Pyrinomonadaceae bacterium]